MGTKIILAVCFIPIVLIMHGVLYWAGAAKGNIVLGVTLWKGGLEEDAVKKIQKDYKRSLWMVTLGFIISFALISIPSRISVVISLQMVWMLLVIVCYFVPFAQCNRKLMAMKWEHQPTAPRREQRTVDIKAAAVPRERFFFKTCLAGVVFSFIPAVGEVFLRKDVELFWMNELVCITMGLTSLICLVLLYYFSRQSTDVVSYNSQVNIMLTRVRRIQWSKFCCILAWSTGLFNLLIWYSLHRLDTAIYFILTGSLVYMAVIVAAAVLAQMRIQSAYKKYITEEIQQVDDDDNWIYGLLYYNKDDNRFMVNKRVGVGTTINVGKKSGKMFMISTLVLVLVVILGSCVWILLDDFSPIKLYIREDSVISAQYKQEYKIPFSDITEAEVIEELPRMSKRVGSSMESLAKGSFMTADYESCRVLVRRQKPPFLRIVAKDGMVYYLNCENPKGTAEIYQAILAAEE